MNQSDCKYVWFSFLILGISLDRPNANPSPITVIIAKNIEVPIPLG